MNKELMWILRAAVTSLLRQGRMWRQDLLGWQQFWKSYFLYKELMPRDREALLKHLTPCIRDNTAQTVIEPIYFYQDLWAFEKIVQQRPRVHLDVGSHHNFVAFLSRILPVFMVDLRPWNLPLDKLGFRKGTVLDLPFEDSSMPSVSSLCVVEHIGLGRYGDPLDPLGTEKAIAELKRIIEPGGDLYLSLPVNDRNITYFNAHRAFHEDYIVSLLEPYHIIDFHYIYGMEFITHPMTGFGIGCYHVKNDKNN
jgi:hypothetical protein